MTLGDRKRLGFTLLTITIVSPVVAYIIPWQYVAEVEAFGIFVIDVSFIILYYSLKL
ncbi:MAG: hypothetical protein ACP5G5_00550 [Thermoplasmata archaeon]